MKKYFLLILLLSARLSFACTSCNKPLQDAIYDSTFYPNIFTMLSAFFVLAVIVIILSMFSARKYQRAALHRPRFKILNPVPLTTAAMILGIGLGGFIDGIWLHQILQWHEMLSNKISADTVLGKSVNMFWDGIFHFYCLIVTLIGVILLWKLLYRNDVSKSGSLLFGGFLMGWGLFNIVEGVFNHHLFKLHFVKQASATPHTGNILFIVISFIMLIAGRILIFKRNCCNQTKPYILHQV